MLITMPGVTVALALAAMPHPQMSTYIDDGRALAAQELAGIPGMEEADRAVPLRDAVAGAAARIELRSYDIGPLYPDVPRRDVEVGLYGLNAAVDWIGTGFRHEMNPTPGLGTATGRLIAFAATAAVLYVVDRQLVEGGHTQASKALRFITIAYLTEQTSWNFGAQRLWTPDYLIPTRWHRDAAQDLADWRAGQGDRMRLLQSSFTDSAGVTWHACWRSTGRHPSQVNTHDVRWCEAR